MTKPLLVVLFALLAVSCSQATLSPISERSLPDLTDFTPSNWDGRPYELAIYGYVVADSTGEPLESVQVWLEDGGLNGALSNEAGQFALGISGAGTYLLRVETIGFVRDSMLVAVDSLSARVDFTLRAQPLCIGDCWRARGDGTAEFIGCC